MKYCTEKTIENISEYLSAVRERGHVVLYRGQAEDWPLIPSIGRVNIALLNGLLEVEEDIVKQLKRYGYPYFKNDISDETDWILHAQHFGLPTRLLDFTQNPLKALYFAVEDSISE
ncbi:FRG domain-containing protein [Aeromonas salmonicida]|uniref:FRG domain-containing protein n=1 Tax=Aeromonas salmonicida TaxID=645 RepID=UPI0031FC94E2